MNHRLITRTAALALSALVTMTTLSAIDTLAFNEHAGSATMAALPASSGAQAAAAATASPRS